MLKELVDEIYLAMKEEAIEEKAGNRIADMLRKCIWKETGSGIPIHWKKKYKDFKTWYDVFEEIGYINYEAWREQNNNSVDNSDINSNNLYLWCKNDLREKMEVQKRFFCNIKTIKVKEINKEMLVLDSGATNGVCSFKKFCFNIREKDNSMD